MRESMQVRGVEFVAVNTDAQDLDYSSARQKIYIGKNLTRGLGAGMNPDIGRQAAEENRSEIIEMLKGADLVFITAGLGGGTGSGASPVIAEIARELGALTVAVVTKPFSFEGAQRARIAQEAFGKLKEKVDAIIAIPNDRIFGIIPKDTPFLKAFEYVDEILKSSVKGIADLVAMPGIINVDFADVRTIMQETGTALVGVGLSAGQDRASKAVVQAVSSPLLEVSIEGAKGILFSVAGGRDMKMSEIHDVARVITEAADSSAKIIFGAYHDRKLKKGQLKVTLIATGFNGNSFKNGESNMSNLFASASLAKENNSFFTSDHPAKEPVKNTQPAPVEKEESKGDEWDTPAFLRKRKR
jgi:cell division protein FtsZ